MPIKGLSERRRLPRLGKIRLGYKVEAEGRRAYPKATDYFVCPEEVKAIFGEKPTELRVMFPVEDEERVCPQWLKRYSFSQGLVCKGDGEGARCRIDLETGAMAGKDTKQAELREVKCEYRECQEYIAGNCKEVMSLQFLLPEVPGLGVYQLDTSSYHSIRNINDCLELIRSVAGRISMIPLTLSLIPMEVHPEGGKKKTVHVVQITTAASLIDIVRDVRKPLGGLIEAPSEEEAPEDFGAKDRNGDGLVIEGVAEVVDPTEDRAEFEQAKDADEGPHKPMTREQLAHEEKGMFSGTDNPEIYTCSANCAFHLQDGGCAKGDEMPPNWVRAKENGESLPDYPPCPWFEVNPRDESGDTDLIHLEVEMKKALLAQFVRLGMDPVADKAKMTTWVHDKFNRYWPDLTYDQKCQVISDTKSEADKAQKAAAKAEK